MKLPEHQHDYSRIDALVQKMNIHQLTYYLNLITSDVCEQFKQTPRGEQGEVMERLMALMELNGAFKDIIVDECRAQLKAEEG